MPLPLPQPADISAPIVTPHSGHILNYFIHTVAYHCMRHICKLRLCGFAPMVYPIGMSASPAFTVARALGLWHDGWIELISDRRPYERRGRGWEDIKPECEAIQGSL